MKSKVYFMKEISPENVVKMYQALGVDLKGKVAVKVHSGEAGNQNYLKPEFMKPMIDYVKGVVVECNTAYGGMRNTSEKHKKLLSDHGWDTYFDVDLLDEFADLKLDIKDGKILKENYVGKNIEKYDSMLILSHFKGHPMGGYGGALKQLSIGCASTKGKCLIHSGGRCDDQDTLWGVVNFGDIEHDQKLFTESMADAAKSVVDYFDGNMAFINVMCNLSVDCDCCSTAEDPCMKDIGILSSLDPVALDQACLDLIYKSDDPGKNHFIKRVESRNGIHTIEVANEMGIGSRDYEFVEIKS